MRFIRLVHCFAELRTKRLMNSYLYISAVHHLVNRVQLSSPGHVHLRRGDVRNEV